jgi:hypothetical protein
VPFASLHAYSLKSRYGKVRIIGISGQDNPQGIPEIAVVIQFWFADDNAIPELVIMKKDAFMKFFLVQED